MLHAAVSVSYVWMCYENLMWNRELSRRLDDIELHQKNHLLATRLNQETRLPATIHQDH